MSQIAVFARVRPAESQQYKDLTISRDSIRVSFGVKDTEMKFTEAQYREHTFSFKEVFNTSSTQEEVYQVVAEPVVNKFLEGYNGTIFAYGQTASGKTYTIEGSARSYNERGLAPRVISAIYRCLGERQEKEDVTVHLSCVEIYQETAYDLLNLSNRGLTISTALPKISVTEGSQGEVVLKNLSYHLAPSEHVALNLLFEGSTCRKVAETVMNASSSRSHFIFTLTLTVQQLGSEVRTRSKLHLVDLAGSERVAKTGADGLVLQEAKYINLSLHHLEHVIVCLQKSRRTTDTNTRPVSQSKLSSYIPYRNSLLTMILRDSLGGNCLTAMIATLSPDRFNIHETVSTCRFSQRVACISNLARRNEELDDKAVIRQLKRKVKELEEELSLLQRTDQPLTSQDKSLCHRVLYDYLHGRIDNPVTAGINTPTKFQECLSVMKDVVLHSLNTKRKSISSSSSGNAPSVHKPESNFEERTRSNVEATNGSILEERTVSTVGKIRNSSEKMNGFVADETNEHNIEKQQGLETNGTIVSPVTPKADRVNRVESIKLTTKSPPVQHVHTSPRQSKMKPVSVEMRQLNGDTSTCLDFQIHERQLKQEQNAEHSHVLEASPDLFLQEEHQVVKHSNRKLPKKIKEAKSDFAVVKEVMISSSPSDPLRSQSKQEQQDELEQLRLLRLERQLELKETATRQRLASLKQQLLSEQNKLNSIGQQAHSHTSEVRNETSEIRNATVPIVQSIVSRQEQDPISSGEVHYTSAVKRQKERVNRIRQCVSAAIVIQRAWRNYCHKH